MENNNLIVKHLKYKYLYSIMGLVIGLVTILCGSYLLINGVIGPTQFSASLFGGNAQLSDAAPGTVLFVIGLFLVIVTRYSKIKIPTSEGGHFYGAPIPQDEQFDMHNFPARHRLKIANVFKNTCSFESVDVSFLRRYLKIHEPGATSVFNYAPIYGYTINKNKGVDDDLWAIYSMSESFDGFIFSCLEHCYKDDKDTNVLQICGCIYDSMKSVRNTAKIVEILQKGIWDKTKGNELRLVFLWLLNYLQTDLKQKFYTKEISRFLYENGSNERLCVSFIESVILNLPSYELGKAIDLAIQYLDTHTGAKNTIKPVVKNKLGIV